MKSFTEFYPVATLMEATLLAGIGFCLLWMKIPAGESLYSYRVSIRILGVSYLLLASINIVAVLVDSDLSHLQRDLYGTLLAAIFHLLLFTYSIVTLIHPRLVTKERLMLEAGPVVLFLVWITWAYFTGREAVVRVAFLLFAGYYVVTLVRCIALYFKEESNYKKRAANYFSDHDERRLVWIRTAFICELLVSLLAFCTLLDPTVASRTMFAGICMLNYVFFAICMMNYAHIFHTIEPVVVDDVPPDADILAARPGDFEERLTVWVANKGYLTPGVTLGELALSLQTNRTYLSSFINNRFGMTFRAWITNLRLEEAKRLMNEHPGLSVGEVAHQTGYTDQSTFTRQFIRSEGTSPGAWRKA